MNSNKFFIGDFVLEHFAKSVNCSVKYHNYEIVDIEDVYENYFEVETGLKYGVDLHIFGSDFVAEEAYHSKIDFSVSFDNYAVCIATPRCGFMSQGLVIFKSFTPVVWVLTLLTIFCFGLVQYGIQYLQGEIFIHLYSETQREYFKISSSLLTVYAYFVCGRPPFLYLGRLITGKILFIIFSFSAIIISTAFLSSLTTLLSNRVSYPEIDSLQALEESDLLIQTTNAEKIAHEQIFDRQKLREKLVSNLASYSTDIFIEAFNGRGVQDILDGGIFNRSSIQALSNNVISILKSDAHLVTVLYTSAQRENILLQDFVFVREALELHLVKECLLTYPVSFLLPKGSFFYDRFNQVVAQFFETGHIKKFLYDSELVFNEFGNYSSVVKDGAKPRAYSLDDLQSAFIGLMVGLFLSFLAFVGELSTDYFQNSVPVKFLRRVNILRPR